MTVSSWPDGRFAGHQALQDALLSTVAVLQGSSAHAGWCSPDWAGWPLDHPDLLAGLQAWMLSGGHLRLLAADYRLVTAQCPRFVKWRVQWAHRIEARSVGRTTRDTCPHMVVSNHLGGWEVLSAERGVLVGSQARSAVVGWQERFDGLWERATAAFPGSTLGL